MLSSFSPGSGSWIGEGGEEGVDGVGEGVGDLVFLGGG